MPATELPPPAAGERAPVQLATPDARPLYRRQGPAPEVLRPVGQDRRRRGFVRPLLAWGVLGVLALVVFGLALPRLADWSSAEPRRPPVDGAASLPSDPAPDSAPEDTTSTTAPPSSLGGQPVPTVPPGSDEVFRELIASTGVDPITAAAAGRAFCWSLDDSDGDVATVLAGSSVLTESSSLDPEHLEDIFDAAISAYCPRWADAWAAAGH